MCNVFELKKNCGRNTQSPHYAATQLDLFAPGTVPPKQPVRQVEVAGPKVDQAGTMPKQFSLADEDDYEELGLSRDNSAASPVMHVHPAFKSD